MIPRNRILATVSASAALMLGGSLAATAAPLADCNLASPAKHSLRAGWSDTPQQDYGYWAGARAIAKISSLGAVNDSTYGPSEKMKISVRNTGTTRTRYLDLQLPNGQVFVDDDGQQTFIGNCRPYALPLSPGQYTTCEAYRLLTDKELATGRTLDLDLVVVLFGNHGPKAYVHKKGVAFDKNKFRS